MTRTAIPKPYSTPKIREVHQDTYIDNFAWIEDIDHAKTLPYLTAENRYTEESTDQPNTRP